MIRCTAHQRIGLLVDSVEALTVEVASIEGCEVGAMILGTGHHLRRLTVRGATICVLAAGSGSLFETNQAGECDYGFVVSGGQNTFVDNVSEQNRKDGFLLFADSNILRGNQATNNGGVGFHLVPRTPMLTSVVPILALQMRPFGNALQGNVASGNGIDLRELGEMTCDPDEMLNEWIDNTAATRLPACLQ
jgi:parallel beta-helix repeat protein